MRRSRRLDSPFIDFLLSLLTGLGIGLALGLLASPATAGELSRAQVERRFPPPLHVQEKLADLAAWPLTSELEPEAGPVGYVFESIDLAPLPGFEGTPFNLLIAIDRKGNFLDVEVLHQHEPVFLGGLGEPPLRDFVKQYAGKNIAQTITISSSYSGARNQQTGGGNLVVLDGVTKATASIRIVNQTILAAALAVARARLGFAAPGQHGPPAKARGELFERFDFAELLRRGMVQRRVVSNAVAEKLFAGSDGEGADEEGLAHPQDALVELYVAYLNPPSIGRSLLGEAQWTALRSMLHGKLEEGQHLLWIASAGRYSMLDERFVPGSPPQRLALRQDRLNLELRDFDFELTAPVGAPPLNASRLYSVYAEAGLDPGRPFAIDLTLIRAKGMMLPRITRQNVSLDYATPAALLAYPPSPPPEWLLAWQARWLDLAIIGAALLLLSSVLARPRWLSLSARRLARFRWAFLAFTLVYLGWYAQGQLSIVQLTGTVKTLRAGQGLASFLYDPVSLLLIAFTLLSLLIWGRGTFCGWLCPFGALQEFVAAAVHRLPARLRPPQVPRKWQQSTGRRLAHLRYVLLAALLLAALLWPTLAEKLVEAEPFKTAITIGFDRPWPYVAYAVLLLLAGASYYKLFCRLLCPLGAALTLGGKLRRWHWLPRRAECGQPCQTCRSRCNYDAIERDGAIRYDDCFQCLDCVGIYHDEQRCAPLLLWHKKGRSVGGTAGGKPA